MKAREIVLLKTGLRTLGVLAVVTYSQSNLPSSVATAYSSCGFPTYIDTGCGTACACNPNNTIPCTPSAYCYTGPCSVDGTCS
jgi:hypothetical protein